MYSIHLYENRTRKQVVSVLSRVWREMSKRECGDEPNQGTLQAYTEMSQ
jgi:hypothetical protein